MPKLGILLSLLKRGPVKLISKYALLQDDDQCSFS